MLHTIQQFISSALTTFATAWVNNEPWALVTVATVLVVGIIGIVWYGVAQVGRELHEDRERREMRNAARAAHSWDRDDALGHENDYHG